MSKFYEYQLFLSLPKSEFPERPQLPPLPQGIQATLAESDSSDAWVWECSLAMGHSRAELDSLVKWFQEDLPRLGAEPRLFDPQLGRQLFMHRDGDAQDLADSIHRHDAWVLNHVGGDSLHVEEPVEILPLRTRMLIIFTLILVGLYFLTHFLLDLYFR